MVSTSQNIGLAGNKGEDFVHIALIHILGVTMLKVFLSDILLHTLFSQILHKNHSQNGYPCTSEGLPTSHYISLVKAITFWDLRNWHGRRHIAV